MGASHTSIVARSRPASEREAADKLTLMLLGPDYSTNKATVAKLVGLKHYWSRASSRLSETGEHAANKTVAIALRRAVDLSEG
jgi:hypothetical protein